MKKIKKYRLNWSSRMTMILMGVIIIPFIILTVFLANMALKNMEKQTETLVEYKLEESSVFLENRLDNIYDILYRMVIDNQLQRSYDAFYNQRGIELAKSNMRERFLSFVQLDEYLVSATYLGMHGEYYTYETFNSAQAESVWVNEILRSNILETNLNGDKIQFIPVNLDSDIGNIGSRLYYITITLRDVVADTDIGVLALGLKKDFFNCLEKGSEWDSLFGGTVNVVDSDGYILYSNDSSAMDEYYNQWLLTMNYEEENSLINTRSLSRLPWTLCSVIERNLIMKDIHNFTMLVLGLVIVSMFISLSGGYIVSKFFTKNLTILADGLKQFGEGKIGMQLPAVIEDEFYPVVVQFNAMSTSIEKLLEERELQEQKTIDAISKQRKAEIRAIEMQINPHFLYNTLDAINWIAIENEQFKISEMLSSLASIFRYSVSNIDMVVPVWVEVEWLDKYLRLQQQRFNNSFYYKITVPENVEDLLVRKMILQPIVENAIIHGVAEIKSGNLEIIFSLEKETLMIKVEDNGVGIDNIDAILKNQNDGRVHIGITNVKDRLECYYGDAANVSFESSPGIGTSVILRIPAEWEEFEA